MRVQAPRRPSLAPLRPLLVALILGAAAPCAARADDPGGDRLLQPGAPAVEGRLRLDPAVGLLFEPSSGGAAPTAPGDVVEFATKPARGAAVPPMFRAAIGESGRISGTLAEIAEAAVTLSVPWRPAPVVVRRPGIQSLTQRLGEVRVLGDDFDALDPSWDAAGGPRAVVEAGESALLLPAVGSSIERRFDPPIEAGRVEVSFHDDGRVHPGRSWTLNLAFRAPGGPAVVRVLLGWGEESLAVESPDGPALAVQRLARGEGWRRAAVRFDARRTEVSIDGQDLAHGRGPEGALESIRIAVEGEGEGEGSPDGLVGAAQVVRFASVPSELEIDPAQDEARLALGDQLFGGIVRGDRDRVEMTVDGRPAAIPWKDLAGLYFRRDPAAGAAISGALARVEWNPGGGPDGEPDFAEGAVSSLTDEALTLQTSYTGELVIPRDRLARLRVMEPGVRLVIDPCSHHLGDEISGASPALDPPMYEGGVLERTFEVPADAPAVGPPSIVLDVVGVVGEATGLMFSDMVRRGELKTYVVVDGKRIDYINRFIDDANETPRRIRVPVPADALRPGPHVLRLEQTGDARDPNAFDDLGVLAVAVEFNPPAPRP